MNGGFEQEKSRPGRKRRATRGNLRRHTTVDAVTIEETISFSMPLTAKNYAETNGRRAQNVAGDNSEIGDGCYISSTINNRRYYGLLIDQNTLLKASELHFMEEAASIDMNRRMMYLHNKKDERKVTEEKRVVSSDGNIKNRDNKKEKEETSFENENTKRQKITNESSVESQSYIPTSSKCAQKNLKIAPKTEQKDMSLFYKEEQVQKFEYILPTVKDKNSPGYRRLLATYANVAAASEEKFEKAQKIYDACQKGGDFVGDLYFQYLVDETALLAKHASVSHDKMIGFRTSLSLHSFLKSVTFPQWYPLSNFKVDQSKILNMLQLKRNNKGGIEWDKQKSTPNRGPIPIPKAISKPLIPINPRNTYRIGVLGGGIAGLSCCWELLRLAGGAERLEVEVTLLEGRSRVGGRLWTDRQTFTTPDGKNFPVDLGASWIHGVEKNPLTDLAKDAKVDFVRASEEVKMLTSDMREVDKDCDKRMGKLFDELLDQATENCWNTDEYIYKNGRYQKAVRWYAANLSNTNSSSNFEPIPSDVPKFRYTSDISVDRAIGVALKKREDRIHLSNQDQNLLLWNTKNTEYALGANITDLSMKYWDADERHAFKGDHVLLKQGYSQIVDYLMKKCGEYPSFKSILDFSVGRVEYARHSATLPYPNRKLRLQRCINLSDTCSVHSSNGKGSHDFDFVVSALPLGVLKNSVDSNQTQNKDTKFNNHDKIVFNPPLPESKRDAIETVGFGLLNKVYLQFPHAFWRKEGNREFLHGTPYLGFEQDLFGNASGFNPHHYMFLDVGHSLCGTEFERSPPVLLTLISGREAVASEGMSEKDLVEDVMKTLRHIFSTIVVPEPIAVRRTMWGSDKFSRGSYTYLPPGSSDQDYHTLQSPVNSWGDSVHAAINGDIGVMRLFFAGEHTTSLHPSMAHGALLSGIRAAREVVAATVMKGNNEDSLKRDHLIPVSLFRQKKPSEAVRCSLCHFPGSRRREGALCAFQRGKHLALVHTNCASYCPEVDVRYDVWKNVIKAVTRGKQISCSLCGRNGATIGCVDPRCSQSFHFGCCEDTGWNFARNGKAYLCDSHRSSMLDDNDNPISITYFRSKNQYAPVICSLCGGVGDTDTQGKLLGFQQGSNQRVLVHSNCLRYSTVVDTWDPSSQTYSNVFEALYRSKKCVACNKPGATIQCAHSSCDLYYHFSCAEATRWNFQDEDTDFYCNAHRPSTHFAKTSDLIIPAPLTFNKDDKTNQKPSFIQHDLFCSGASSSKGSDAVQLSVELNNTTQEVDIKEEKAENTTKKEEVKAEILRSENNDNLDESKGSDIGSDSESEGDSDDESYSENEENDLMQAFTADPHIADEEIGRTYVHGLPIRANRVTVQNPWKIDLMIDRASSSKTTTLRVDRREKEEPPYGMKKGDIIVSINGAKVGSSSLSIITNVLAVMKSSVELHFFVLRKSQTSV